MEPSFAYHLETGFKPPWWLRNAHVQSILPSIAPRRRLVQWRCAQVRERSEPLVLDCGDGVRLLAQYTPAVAPAARGVVLLLHGWEGEADSMYMLALARRLLAGGFAVLRLNLRDHGGTQQLNRGLFHSCLLPEVAGAVAQAQARFAGLPLHLVGFSLGGNFFLRVAADAARTGLDLASVAAISPVLEPRATLAAIESGLPVYQNYFLRKWSDSLRGKQRAWPQDYDFGDLKRHVSLRRLTAELVERHTTYPTLDAYLDGYAITGARLAALATPALIVTAADDPIVPVKDLARLATTASLKALVTPQGGHCGFITGLAGNSWAEDTVLAHLTRAGI